MSEPGKAGSRTLAAGRHFGRFARICHIEHLPVDRRSAVVADSCLAQRVIGNGNAGKFAFPCRADIHSDWAGIARVPLADHPAAGADDSSLTWFASAVCTDIDDPACRNCQCRRIASRRPFELRGADGAAYDAANGL